MFLDAGFDEFPHSHGGRLGCGGRKAGGLNVSPHRDTAGPRLQLTSESGLTESELCLCASSHLYLRLKRSCSPAVLDRRQDVLGFPQRLLEKQARCCSNS